jgi:simple sugar transport system permease protein
MNFVAIYLAAWLVHGPLQESRGVFPQTEQIVGAARLPPLVEGARLHWGFVLAVVLAVVLWAFVRWTVPGFRIRAVGASPEAARIAGRINPDKVALRAGCLRGGDIPPSPWLCWRV